MKKRFNPMGVFLPILMHRHMLQKEAGEGEGGSGGADPKEQLLKQIKDTVDKQLEGRSAEFKNNAQEIFDNALNGLPLEALRSYSEDKTKIDETVKKLASSLEKIEQRANKIVEQNRSAIEEQIDKNWNEIQTVIRNKRGVIELSFRAAVEMDTTNIIEYPEDGLSEDIIESFSVGAFVEKRRPKEYIFDIADRTTVTGIKEYKTWLEEGDVEGAFAIVEEGELKPLVSLSLVRNESKYRKIAAKQVYTEEVPKFRREAYNIIRRLIQDKLLRDYAAILTTDLVNAAALYVSSALDGQYANPTDYHAIGAVAAQIESLDFVPDVLILNPQDKWRIGLSQDLQGQFYLTIPVTDPSGQTRMMGFWLRTTNRMPVGKFMLGESGLWKIEDEPITVRLGYGVSVTTATVSGTEVVTSVESDIDHNRFRIIAETFFHNYIATNHTGSYVYGDFAAIKALLQSEEEEEPIEG